MRWAITFFANRALVLIIVFSTLDAYARTSGCGRAEATYDRVRQALINLTDITRAIR